MEGTLKADKHFVTFPIFEPDEPVMEMEWLFGPEHDKERGYVWIMGFIDDVSYMVDIMPLDEVRHMYE